MTNSDDKNVKRYGRNNQKEQLQRPDSVFPPEAELDIDSLLLPDTNSEALQSLATLSDEVKAPRITPQEERFPPLAPSHEAETPAEIEETDLEKEISPARNIFYNILTVLTLLATIAFIVWSVAIWNNPQSVWNPLPPSTPFVVVTATPGEIFLGITSTPDESGQIFVVVTDTPLPQINSAHPFIAQADYRANTNDMGCDWWSIAGTVTNRDGDGLTGYRVRIIGQGLNETIFSGTAPTFGDGGFEFPLAGTPQESNFTVQLFGPQNDELSEAISIRTRIDCDANVAYLIFVGNS